MVALTDMTVQYTVLVDAHIPRLAACLADPNELVRRQALALLASLLSRVSYSPPAASLAVHAAGVSSELFSIPVRLPCEYIAKSEDAPGAHCRLS